VCVCSRRHRGCDAHTPYCHLWPVRLCNIFPHYLINDNIFEKKKFLNIGCVSHSTLQLLSETFLILIRSERDMIKMHIDLHVQCPLFLSDFNKTWIFLGRFSKNTQISNFMEIPPVGRRFFFFHAKEGTDGQRDITKFCELAQKLLMSFLLRNLLHSPYRSRSYCITF